jgi:hypothetical protein
VNCTGRSAVAIAGEVYGGLEELEVVLAVRSLPVARSAQSDEIRQKMAVRRPNGMTVKSGAQRVARRKWIDRVLADLRCG